MTGTPSSHETRITDNDKSWRLFYRLDSDAIVIAEMIKEKTGKTPKTAIDTCKARFRSYDDACR